MSLFGLLGALPLRLAKSFTSLLAAFVAAICPRFTSAIPPCAAFAMNALSASDTDADVPVVDVVLDVSVADVLVVLAKVSVVAVSDVVVSFFLHPKAIRETIASRKIQFLVIGFVSFGSLQCMKSSSPPFTAGGKVRLPASSTRRASCKAVQTLEERVSAGPATGRPALRSEIDRRARRGGDHQRPMTRRLVCHL